MPMHKDSLTQALHNVSDDKWRSHQGHVTKTPLSRYSSSSSLDGDYGRFNAVTPPSADGKGLSGIGSPGIGRSYSGNGFGSPVSTAPVSFSSNRRGLSSSSTASVYGSPYLREDEQPNPRTLPTAVATFTPTGNIKVELKSDVHEVGTPVKRRLLYIPGGGSSSSSSFPSPSTPSTPNSKRFALSSPSPSAFGSSVHNNHHSGDLRTPTPRRKRATKRLLSGDEGSESSSSCLSPFPSSSVAPAPSSRRSSAAASSAKARVDGSLVTITQGFIDLLSASETKSLDINKVAVRLGIPKRRIYDITNALEGIGFLKKGVKNMVHWTGVNAECINPVYQTLAQDLSDMKEEDATLDQLISAAREQLDSLLQSGAGVGGGKRMLWVTHEDLFMSVTGAGKGQGGVKGGRRPEDRLLLPIHAPLGTTVDCSSEKLNHKVYLKSSEGPITVSLLSAADVAAEEGGSKEKENRVRISGNNHHSSDETQGQDHAPCPDLKPLSTVNSTLDHGAAGTSTTTAGVKSEPSVASPSFAGVKTEKLSNGALAASPVAGGSGAGSIPESPTQHLLRLLDSPNKTLDPDWRRLFGQGIADSVADSAADPSDFISLPLELEETDYNFVMDGTEGLSTLFDFNF